MFGIFRRNHISSEVEILKTNNQKSEEEKMANKKMLCPNCGNHPRGGIYHNGIVLGTTDLTYTYITCTHCNCDYKYIK